MLEMEMTVARSEFEKSVLICKAPVAIGIHVRQRASNEDIGVPDVGGRHSEAQEGSCSRCDATFLYAAEVCGEVLNAYKPVILRCFPIHNQVRQADCIDRVLNERSIVRCNYSVVTCWTTGVHTCSD
jgi:hypothetical protein